MEKKLLVTIILVVVASLSIAGCINSSTPASPTPTAAASSANSPTSSVATQTQASPTSVPTTPQATASQASPTPQRTVATPANVPTATPSPAIGTWSGSVTVDNPGSWQFPQGSSVTLDIHITSGTSTGLAGQTVTLTSNGQQVATAVTNSNGDASATISTAGWTIGYHSITASNLGIQFAATGFSVIAAK